MAPKEAPKERPWVAVATESYDLAELFLGDYVMRRGIHRKDLEWELADVIQRAIETWLEEAAQRIKER